MSFVCLSVNLLANPTLSTVTNQSRVCIWSIFSRWEILRSAISVRVNIKRVISWVNALAKLHRPNFCINVSEPVAPEESPTDLMGMMSNSGAYVPIERSHGVVLAPRGLVDGGNHFRDVPRDVRRRWMAELAETNDSISSVLLVPQERLLRKVIESQKVPTHVDCTRKSRKKK